MNVLDLFSGIGGFSLGLERAGMKTVAFCEVEKYPQQVLKKHWPEVPIYDDIQTLTAERLRQDGIGSIDVVCGGFPCQPFSQAGKQRGFRNDRDLWPEMFRVIQEVRPAWVIGESVAGFVSMGLERTIANLESEAYEVQPFVIPACAVKAPHRRDRVWIVANANSIRIQGKGPIGEQITQSPAGEMVSGCGCAGEGAGQWEIEPDVGGSLNGFPCFLDRHCGKGLSYAESKRRTEVLRFLWSKDVAEVVCQTIGGLGRMEASNTLFSVVREHEKSGREARPKQKGQETLKGILRKMWIDQASSRSSQGQKLEQQHAGEYRDHLSDLSREFASWNSFEGGLDRVAKDIPHWVDQLKGLGNAVVPQAVEVIGRAIIEANQ